MSQKTKSEQLKIRGAAVYPKTDRPYKFDKAAQKSVVDYDEGKYELNVAVDAETAEKFQTKLKAFSKEQGLKAPKNWPWKPEIDKESDEETGRVLFTARQYAKTKDGSTKSIGHYDAKAAPLPKGFKLTTGSTVIMACHPGAYKTLGGGVNLYLDAVQVLEYVEPQGYNPFDKEDGSFTSDDAGDDTNTESEEDNKNEEPSDF